MLCVYIFVCVYVCTDELYYNKPASLEDLLLFLFVISIGFYKFTSEFEDNLELLN